MSLRETIGKVKTLKYRSLDFHAMPYIVLSLSTKVNQTKYCLFTNIAPLHFAKVPARFH